MPALTFFALRPPPYVGVRHVVSQFRGTSRSPHWRYVLFLLSALWTCGAQAVDFSGHWRDDQPCGADGHGAHYSLTLKRIGRDHYAGLWESGTNTRGSGGKVYGRNVGGILNVEGCIAYSYWAESEDEMCPQLRSMGSYSMRSGKLVGNTKAASALPKGATVV